MLPSKFPKRINISYIILMAASARFHLPGLFEFHEFYRIFLPLFSSHREYFYQWAEIGSVYGAPADCLWGGGRAGFGQNGIHKEVAALAEKYGIPCHLTFSNSLLQKEHLADRKCNELCRLFHKKGNGIIVHSDLLLDYLKQNYPDYSFISSTTKVLKEPSQFLAELSRPEFTLVVPDFRLNKRFDVLDLIPPEKRSKLEFLCNECCWFECPSRKECYEHVSRKILGTENSDWECRSPDKESGYVFSKAMKNPGFISIDDIQNLYLPKGFTDFKIEGRSLGSALILEFLLYYMVKPEYQLNVREAVYLDNTLDLF